MSTNTELQNLLTKMGGSPSEEDSNSDLIKKISTIYEGGGSGGVLVVHATLNAAGGTGTLDKTWKEIHDAKFAVVAVEEEGAVGFMGINAVSSYGGVYSVAVLHHIVTGSPSSPQIVHAVYIFDTDSEDGYPVYNSSKDSGK